MAYFAQIKDNFVIDIAVVANEVLGNATGLEAEAIGIDFCKSLYGADTEWLQTSYNGTFRGSYSAIGMIYNSELDVFEYTAVTEEIPE
jgi:hypothetical protein